MACHGIHFHRNKHEYVKGSLYNLIQYPFCVGSGKIANTLCPPPVCPLQSLLQRPLAAQHGQGTWALSSASAVPCWYILLYTQWHILNLDIRKLAFLLELLIALWANYSLPAGVGNGGPASHSLAGGGHETVYFLTILLSWFLRRPSPGNQFAHTYAS